MLSQSISKFSKTMTSQPAFIPQKNKKNLDNDEGNYVIKSPLLNNETTNPCIKEQNLTTKCMFDNNYLREKCVDTFDNYTECKRFWKYVTWIRWYNGITPYLPPPEERERVKKETIEKFLNRNSEL